MSKRRWHLCPSDGGECPLAHRTDAEVLAEMGVDAVARWLVDQGYVVMHHLLCTCGDA